jgi:multidrug transporter EmrE-like cation transporter
MKTAVWIVSALLALFFLFVGSSKAFASWEVLEAASKGIPVILLKIAGVAEILGAVGLIVPAATRILPMLTPIAAVGLGLTMIGATSIDIGLGLPAGAILTGLAGILSAFVAWARFSGRAAVAPRGAATSAA